MKPYCTKGKNQSVKEEILAIYQEYRGSYGYRRIQLELRNRGFLSNHKKVQRLMKDFLIATNSEEKQKLKKYF